MTKELGQPVIVENKPGATGVVGLETLERSRPDGYTLLLFNGSTAVAHVAQKRGFDFFKKMTPLGNVVTSSVVVFVNPKLIDVNNLDELANFLRKGSDVNYATSGTGSPAHIHAEAWSKKNGVGMTHVAYRGIANALTDLLGDRIGVLITTGTGMKPHIESGKLRPIAVLSNERLSLMPSIRTAKEQGHPELAMSVLVGIAVTAGTPELVVETLRRAVETVVHSAAYRKAFVETDSSPQFISGPEWGAMVQVAYDNAARMVKEMGLSID
jgi:tripartite-type tricarboxylate transporter receptor subunit TctC